ncbi:leucine-rich repeat-domain-containing protein [Zopfochytrium polystomum]|nr:leucine-rich repeat-domain-containing protein [Zopfochytrium polystomum]
MKLDYDVLTFVGESCVDPLKDRVFVLRGLKIPRIENLAILKNQYDTLDLTDNDLTALNQFPLMPRLKTLLVSNNRITKLDGPNLSASLPNLDSLILTNNAISDLGAAADALRGLKKLTHLSLEGNPVTKQKHYRSWIVWRCKGITWLDFRRVTDAERREAKLIFSGAAGSKLAASLSSGSGKRTLEEEAADSAAEASSSKRLKSGPQALSPEEAAKLRAALEKATTLEEMERLRRLLEAGGAVPK